MSEKADSEALQARTEGWKLTPEERKAVCTTEAESKGHSLGDWHDEIVPDGTNPDKTHQISRSVCKKNLPHDDCVADAWYFKEEGDPKDYRSYGGLALAIEHGHPYSTKSYNQRLASQAKAAFGDTSLTHPQRKALDLGIDILDQTLVNASKKK